MTRERKLNTVSPYDCITGRRTWREIFTSTARLSTIYEVMASIYYKLDSPP